MTAFRISRETRERLEFYDVVVGWAVQPTCLRWDYTKKAARPKREDSPWEIALYPNVPFPTVNSEELAHGFGDTPDEAVDRALSHPNVCYRSVLTRAMWFLEQELRALLWSMRWAMEKRQRGSWTGRAGDDLDDDIPF